MPQARSGQLPRHRSAERIDPRDAEMGCQLVLALPYPDETKRDMMRVIRRDTVQLSPNKKAWFIMLYPEQFAWVYDELKKRKEKRQLALDIWCHLPRFIRTDTGEILRSRDELARLHDCAPRDITKVMKALSDLGAVKRVPDGRGVRYFLNPKVGTHVEGELGRVEAEKGWPDVPAATRDLFDVIEGGRRG